MRPMRPMRALLALLILSSAVSAQKQWVDRDFSFRFNPPADMREVSKQEKVQSLGFEAANVENPPRPDSETVTVAHHHLWLEQPGMDVYRRQIDLRLVDEIPFGGPEDLRAWLTASGLEITSEQKLSLPLLGLMVEGTFARPDGVTMRQQVIFLSRLGRYAVLTLQAYDSDFEIVRAEFQDVIESIRFSEALNKQPERLADSLRQRGVGAERQGWGDLQVAGSLALAAALILAMVLGGKGRP